MILSNIFLILVAVQLMIIAECQVPITMSANYKYSYIGKYVIDINSQISVTNSTNWLTNPAVFTVPYPQSLSGYDALVDPIIDDISAINVFQGISMRVYLNDANGTSMQFYLYTKNANNIKKISISYAIFYNNVTFAGNFAAYKYNLTVNKNVSNSNPYEGAIVLPTIINRTGGVNTYGVIAGMDVEPTDLFGTISIVTSFQVLSQSQLGFSISSSFSTSTYIKQMAYVVITIRRLVTSSTVVEQTNINSMSYSNQQLQIQHFNIFIGLTSFSLSNQTNFEFFTTVTSNQSFVVNSSQIYNYLSASYLLVYFKYCYYKYPYLYSSDNLCYLSCPSKTQANQSSLQCEACTSCKDTQSNHQQLPTYVIALIVLCVVIFIIVVLIIAIFIYRYIKNTKEDTKLETKDAFSHVRKIISFKKENYLQACDNKQNESPKFHTLEENSKSRSKLILDKEIQMKQFALQKVQTFHQLNLQPQWKEAQQNLKFQQFCFCQRDKPYLRCNCNHNFHLTCLLDWLVKDKQERRCPLCRREIPTMAEFYCNRCRKYYKKIDLDYFNEDRRRLQRLQINCSQCPI